MNPTAMMAFFLAEIIGLGYHFNGDMLGAHIYGAAGLLIAPFMFPPTKPRE